MNVLEEPATSSILWRAST